MTKLDYIVRQINQGMIDHFVCEPEGAVWWRDERFSIPIQLGQTGFYVEYNGSKKKRLYIGGCDNVDEYINNQCLTSYQLAGIVERIQKEQREEYEDQKNLQTVLSRF